MVFSDSDTLGASCATPPEPPHPNPNPNPVKLWNSNFHNFAGPEHNLINRRNADLCDDNIGLLRRRVQLRLVLRLLPTSSNVKGLVQIKAISPR